MRHQSLLFKIYEMFYIHHRLSPTDTLECGCFEMLIKKYYFNFTPTIQTSTSASVYEKKLENLQPEAYT